MNRDALPLGRDFELCEGAFDVFETRLQGGNGCPDLPDRNAQFAQAAQGFERDKLRETEAVSGCEEALLFPCGKLSRGDAEHPAHVFPLPRSGGDRILFDALDSGRHRNRFIHYRA